MSKVCRYYKSVIYRSAKFYGIGPKWLSLTFFARIWFSNFLSEPAALWIPGNSTSTSRRKFYRKFLTKNDRRLSEIALYLSTTSNHFDRQRYLSLGCLTQFNVQWPVILRGQVAASLVIFKENCLTLSHCSNNLVPLKGLPSLISKFGAKEWPKISFWLYSWIFYVGHCTANQLNLVVVVVTSVTRFGKILPLWQNIKSLRQFFEDSLIVGKIFNPLW